MNPVLEPKEMLAAVKLALIATFGDLSDAEFTEEQYFTVEKIVDDCGKDISQVSEARTNEEIVQIIISACESLDAWYNAYYNKGD